MNVYLARIGYVDSLSPTLETLKGGEGRGPPSPGGSPRTRPPRLPDQASIRSDIGVGGSHAFAPAIARRR